MWLTVRRLSVRGGGRPVGKLAAMIHERIIDNVVHTYLITCLHTQGRERIRRVASKRGVSPPRNAARCGATPGILFGGGPG